METDFKNANFCEAGAERVGPKSMAEAELTERLGCNCSSTLGSCAVRSRVLIPAALALQQLPP